MQRRFWQAMPRFLVPALLVALIVMPATPSRAAHTRANSVTIQLWDSDNFPPLYKHLDVIMSKYQKSHPNIHLKFLHNQALSKTLTAIASGSGPDIVWLWDSAIPIGAWANNGVIQPLDTFIKQSHYNVKQLVPAAVDQSTWRGHIWALPLVADTYWLWYNVKDLQAAGIKHPPTTLEEVVQDGVKLTQKTGSGRILRLGYNLPTFLNGNNTSSYAAVYGGSLLNKNGTKVTPDNKGTLAAWHEIRREWALYDKLFGHDALVRLRTSAQSAGFTAQDYFLNDRIAMKIDGDWIPQQVRDFKPSWKYGVDYAAVPVPAPKGYQRYAGRQPIATYPLVISKKSQNPQEAWNFIRWLQEPAQTSEIAAYLYNLPQYKAALHSAKLTKLPGFNRLLPMLNSKVKLVTEAPSPVSDQYYTVLEGYENKIDEGQISPEAAMKQVRTRMQPILNKELSSH